MSLEITLDNCREVSEGRNTYVVYRLTVRMDTWENVVEKRYSEFLELHRVMKLFRRLLHEPLPRFPG